MNEFGNQSKSYLSELVKLTKYNLTACGYQNLPVSSSVVSLTVPSTANYALIVVESSISTPAIRYLELGTTTPPSSTEGIPRSNLDAFDISGYNNLINFRAIEISSGTHSLKVQYYK